jgi:hypothetical protein
MSNDWSKSIRKRDGNKCRVCNGTDNLTAHHLYSKSAYPHLKDHPCNGIALCRECHQQYHQDRGSDNTSQQFKDWYFTQFIQNKVNSKVRLKKVVNICDQMTKVASQMNSFAQVASAKEGQHHPVGQLPGFTQYMKEKAFHDISIKVPDDLMRKIVSESAQFNMEPREYIQHLIAYTFQPQ